MLPLAQADTQEEIVQRLARRRFLCGAHLSGARSRREADAHADRRGDDVSEASPSFSNPGHVRSGQVTIELIMHPRRPTFLIDAVHDRQQSGDFDDVSDAERGGTKKVCRSDRGQRTAFCRDVERVL